MKETTSQLFTHCEEPDFYVLSSNNKREEVFVIQTIDDGEDDFKEVLKEIEKEDYDYCYGDYDHFFVEYGKVIFKKPVEIVLGNIKRLNKSTNGLERTDKTICVKELHGTVYPQVYYTRKSNNPCEIEFVIKVETFIEYGE